VPGVFISDRALLFVIPAKAGIQTPSSEIRTKLVLSKVEGSDEIRGRRPVRDFLIDYFLVIVYSAKRRQIFDIRFDGNCGFD